MHAAAELLRGLESELRTLLSQVGDDVDGPWKASWARCQALFARYEASPPVLSSLSAEDRADVERALADVVRLNAVAVGLVGQETEKVQLALRGIATSRRRVREQSDDADTSAAGASCDVRG